jgi:dipeptidyl aminopeptidase/acylaminoacyl peptidase
MEVGDIHAAKQWALDSFAFLDPARVGLICWSHGGLIALMESFDHPKEYACVFAGVPVSDLVMRMGTTTRTTWISTPRRTTSASRCGRTFQSTSAVRRCGTWTSSPSRF